ncbi:hypothetical protein E4U55_004537 [Claviceps digitariae]|nr:hypothetical protein E4U55_004537 [Claviceps digitariae]
MKFTTAACLALSALQARAAAVDLSASLQTRDDGYCCVVMVAGGESFAQNIHRGTGNIYYTATDCRITVNRPHDNSCVGWTFDGADECSDFTSINVVDAKWC